jgi:hypothetical protein
MPRPGTHLLGILLVVVLAGCGGQAASGGAGLPAPTSTPTVQTGPPRAPQSIAFSGDVSGTLGRLAIDDPQHQSECTGNGSRSGGTFAATFYGYVGDAVYGVVLIVKPYRGPGSYAPTVAQVEVHSRDEQHVWQASDGDAVTLAVDAGEMTGSVDATLHNATTNQATLQIKGHWSCRPS